MNGKGMARHIITLIKHYMGVPADIVDFDEGNFYRREDRDSYVLRVEIKGEDYRKFINEWYY